MAAAADALRDLVLELEEERVRCVRASDIDGLRLLAERVAAELPAGGSRTWLLGEIARNCERPWSPGADGVAGGWPERRTLSLQERVSTVEWVVTFASAVGWIVVVADVASRLLPYVEEDRHLPLEEGIRQVVILAVAAFLTGLLAPRRARWREVAVSAAAAGLALTFAGLAIIPQGEQDESPFAAGVVLVGLGLPAFVLVLVGRATRLACSWAVRRSRRAGH